MLRRRWGQSGDLGFLGLLTETGTEARCRGVGVGEVGSNKVGLGEEGPSSNRRAGDLGTERAQPNLYTELKAAGGTALRRPVASHS